MGRKTVQNTDSKGTYSNKRQMGEGGSKDKGRIYQQISWISSTFSFSGDHASHIARFCPLQFMGPETGLKANSKLAQEWEGLRGECKYPFLKKSCNHLADYLTLWNAVRSETGSPFSVATAPRSNL